MMTWPCTERSKMLKLMSVSNFTMHSDTFMATVFHIDGKNLFNIVQIMCNKIQYE